MTKPLLIAAIVFSIGAAALGFLNRNNLTATKESLETANTELASTKSELDSTKKEVASQKEQITSLSSEKDTLTANLGEAQTELATAKSELTAAQEKATAAETELASLKTDAEAKDTRIAELEQQIADGASASTGTAAGASDEAAAERDELRTVVAGLQDKNTALEAQIAELRRKEESRQKVQMRQGLQGTVLAVNQAWNFVVLSLGDRQGVVPNAEMLVQRGNQLVGRIRVTSVEPSTSIADILVRTVPRGLSVMPGDTVIYQAQRD